MAYEFIGQDANDGSGRSVSSAGDVDGDGLADLLIGAREADGLGNGEGSSGSTYLIKAADLAALDAADGTVDGIIALSFVAAPAPPMNSWVRMRVTSPASRSVRRVMWMATSWPTC